MDCYINKTGRYLPGPAIDNDHIEDFLGSLKDESEVKRQVLAMNGIVSRHYAQDSQQRSTEDVYKMATKAVDRCLEGLDAGPMISYLAAGTTYAPYAGPGLASLIHPLVSQHPRLNQPIEISSHSGICSSAAAALVGAIRAIKSQEHRAALAIGTEHSSEVLKSTRIHPIDDRSESIPLRDTQWFMSVFLRFMLSDGAGAMLLEDEPNSKGLSLAVDWTHSLSMAHECPLCMRLDNQTGLLSQDVRILNRHLFPAAESFVRSALSTHDESLASYRVVLPHLSSFFFRRKMERMLEKFTEPGQPVVPYWTNLATAGNTGAASIYIMLDEFLATQSLCDGDRMLLFVPESGQFNFVLISLTAVYR
jgi:3-oxoacyl-[acyl-carrier-protein] synthase III